MTLKQPYNNEEANALAGLARGIEGCEIGLIIREEAEGEVKVSIRTTTNYSALDIAARFGGGGHKQAAGCTIMGTIDDAKKSVIAAVNEIM